MNVSASVPVPRNLTSPTSAMGMTSTQITLRYSGNNQRAALKSLTDVFSTTTTWN